MAEEQKDEELQLEDTGKKKKLIIIIAVVVLLVAGGGGAFFFMGGSDDAEQQAIDAALDTGEAPKEDPSEAATEMGSALYVPMPRPFRFNVPGSVRDRFVEIRVQLLVRGGDNEETAKKNVPLLESTLLSVFSQANADDLATSAGKAELKQKALAAVQQEMMDIANKKVIEQVLFTGFVMQ